MNTAELEPVEAEAKTYDNLEDAIEVKSSSCALKILKQLDWEDQRRAVSRLSNDDAETLVQILDSEDSAELLQHLTEAQAVEIIENIPSEEAAAILDELPTDECSNILRELDKDDAKKIIAGFEEKADRIQVRKILRYEEGTAGSLISGNPVSFSAESTVGEVLLDLGTHAEDYSDRDVQYLYIVEEDKKLVGVLRLRDLVLSLRAKPVRELMIPEPFTVIDTMPLDELAETFQEKKFFGLPVINEEGKLIGVVPRASVEHETAEEQTDMFLRSSGIVAGEEIRSMPLRVRCVKRLAWLGPNIVLNIAAASIIAANEATLQEVIALAVFLPIVSDMSGCSGNQAVAISIRELTLGILRPGDFMRVVVKEGLVGVINGSILGFLLGCLAFLYKGNIFLGLTVFMALSVNTIISVLLGGLIPLMLKKFKVDPAIASGPILTTCTDMCGFLLVLTIASAFITQLSGM